MSLYLFVDSFSFNMLFVQAENDTVLMSIIDYCRSYILLCQVIIKQAETFHTIHGKKHYCHRDSTVYHDGQYTLLQ